MIDCTNSARDSHLFTITSNTYAATYIATLGVCAGGRCPDNQLLTPSIIAKVAIRYDSRSTAVSVGGASLEPPIRTSALMGSARAN